MQAALHAEQPGAAGRLCLSQPAAQQRAAEPMVAHARAGQEWRVQAACMCPPACSAVESQRAAHLKGLGALVHQVAHQHDGVAAVLILAPAAPRSTHPVALPGVQQRPAYLSYKSACSVSKYGFAARQQHGRLHYKLQSRAA